MGQVAISRDKVFFVHRMVQDAQHEVARRTPDDPTSVLRYYQSKFSWINDNKGPQLPKPLDGKIRVMAKRAREFDRVAPELKEKLEAQRGLAYLFARFYGVSEGLSNNAIKEHAGADTALRTQLEEVKRLSRAARTEVKRGGKDNMSADALAIYEEKFSAIRGIIDGLRNRLPNDSGIVERVDRVAHNADKFEKKDKPVLKRLQKQEQTLTGRFATFYQQAERLCTETLKRPDPLGFNYVKTINFSSPGLKMPWSEMLNNG